MQRHDSLPSPPATIFGNTIILRYSHVFAGNAKYGQVPGYHFRIVTHPDGRDAGHINFRIGETPHVLQVAGHIGYEIIPGLRGNGYAEEACRALSSFVKRFYDKVIITADPANSASLHIIEKLGCRFLDEVRVPENDVAFQAGARLKRRYCWMVKNAESNLSD